MKYTEEEILRRYLKRKIAEKNITFSSISYKYKEQARTMRTNMFKYFARGVDGTFDMTASNLNLKKIREDIERTGNNMSPYNYFDLDTLIAYDKYLEIILDKIFNQRERSGRKFFLLEDFNNAIDFDAPEYMIKNAGKKETGFYDIHCPIRTLTDENGRVKYERTPDKKSFEKKYNTADLEKMLSEYIVSKHKSQYTPTKTQQNPLRTNYTQRPKEKVKGLDFIEYDGEHFEIYKVSLYLDMFGSPVKYIEGQSDNGRQIRGFFDMSGDVYQGDLYDTDGNFVHSREESGVIVTGFYKGPKDM